MASTVRITDNGEVKVLSRRIKGVSLNHNQDGLHGFIRYKGVDIRVYSDKAPSSDWHGNAADTLIKQWSDPVVVVPVKPEAQPMKVKRYFSGYQEVTVLARSRKEAIEVAEQYPINSFETENTITFEGGAVEVEHGKQEDLTYLDVRSQDLIDKHIRSKYDN